MSCSYRSWNPFFSRTVLGLPPWGPMSYWYIHCYIQYYMSPRQMSFYFVLCWFLSQALCSSSETQFLTFAASWVKKPSCLSGFLCMADLAYCSLLRADSPPCKTWAKRHTWKMRKSNQRSISPGRQMMHERFGYWDHVFEAMNTFCCYFKLEDLLHWSTGWLFHILQHLGI